MIIPLLPASRELSASYQLFSKAGVTNPNAYRASELPNKGVKLVGSDWQNQEGPCQAYLESQQVLNSANSHHERTQVLKDQNFQQKLEMWNLGGSEWPEFQLVTN